MARLNPEAIETFMNITGSSETVSIQKLEENDGDLNRAVDAYFSEGSRNLTHDVAADFTQDDAMDIDDTAQVETHRPPFSRLSPNGNINPFSLLDPSFTRSIFDTGTSFTRDAPLVSHPRGLREIPIEFKDGNDESGHSGHAPVIEDVTGTAQAYGTESHGIVTVDDDDEDFPTGPQTHVLDNNRRTPNYQPNAPAIEDLTDYNNDIEEEMIKAAIEASKRDAILLDDDNVAGSSIQHAPSPVDDPELARAVSLSLKAAEREKEMHKLEAEHPNLAGAKYLGKVSSSSKRLDMGNSLVIDDDDDDVEEQPLVRHRSTTSHTSLGSADAVADIEEVDGQRLSPQHHDTLNPPQVNGSIPHSEEWGGISSEEHDEAVMLEAAMFGGVPERGYRIPYAPHHFMQNGENRNEDSVAWRMPRPPSPTLTAQRLLREQQDDEYLAALQADREKELKAIEEAEAARAEQRLKEEELLRKLEKEQEIEREITEKEASLPKEPTSDDENSVTLLVRMPDGSRSGRRFLKYDKLQYLFDFIDASRKVKPGTYRLVRPYPRKTFGDEERGSTLQDLGLTSKQEALFLELI